MDDKTKEQINAAIDLLKKEVCEKYHCRRDCPLWGNCCMYIYLWKKIE